MELDPRRLLVLSTIAAHGGVAAAARALGTTPSAVSQQLSRLELDVGVPLVDRGVSSVRLTMAGRMLAGYGERVEQTLADAGRELAAYAAQASGTINVGLPASAIPYVVSTALPRLAERHPDIEVRLVEAYTEDGLPALRAGELDLVIVADDRDTAIPVPPGIHSFVLFEGLYRIVVPGSWPLPSSPAELDGRPWIGAPPGSARARAFARFAAAHGVTPGFEHVAVLQRTTQTMVSAGLGAAILPEYLAATIPGAAMTELEVPGTFLARIFRRHLSDHSVPAVEAVTAAVYDAMLTAAEEYSDLPDAPRPVTVVHPKDPSRTASSRPKPPGAAVRRGPARP